MIGVVFGPVADGAGRGAAGDRGGAGGMIGLRGPWLGGGVGLRRAGVWLGCVEAVNGQVMGVEMG